MWSNAENSAAGANVVEYLAHLIIRVVKMILITDNDKITFTGKHFDDIFYDRFTVDPD